MAPNHRHFDQAVEAHRRGQWQQADGLYRTALVADPTYHPAWHLLGVASFQSQKPRQAVDYIRHAIDLCDTDATYHHHLAAAYVALEDWPEAAASLQAVNRLTPDRHEICYQLGQVYGRLRNWSAASAILTHAVKLNPSHAPSWFELAHAQEQLGQREHARLSLQEVLSLIPDDVPAWSRLGTMWQADGHYNDALACYRTAIQFNPLCLPAWTNTGSIHHIQGDIDKALACYDRALQIEPQHADTWNNRGVLLKEQGQLDQASQCFERALAADPDHVDAHHNRSLLRLSTGELINGWEEYTWRWKLPEFGHPSTTFSPWQGPDSNAAHVWFYAEQGLGDEILFAGCFADLVERRINCTIECDARLLPIYARSFPSLRFVSRPANEQSIAQLPRDSVQSPLGDLPKWFRSNFESFARQKTYLHADAHLRAHWRDHLHRTKVTHRIGIAWQGGKDPIARRHRSTNLADWQSLFQIDGIAWWNLQHGPERHAWDRLRREGNLTSLQPTPACDPTQDLESFAALLAELDLIISIDNSTVHLAGALGRPTWVLLPAVADWRWFLDRNDSPWYPSLTLLRQAEPGNWNDLFHKVSNLLTEILSASIMPSPSGRRWP
ncbi:MAG: tetratricopeptide repeat protein [Planctomycetaceae bacterium]